MICNILFGNTFLDMTLKANNKIKISGKLNFMKVQSNQVHQNTLKYNPSNGRKIFADHVFDWWLIPNT